MRSLKRMKDNHCQKYIVSDIATVEASYGAHANDMCLWTETPIMSKSSLEEECSRDNKLKNKQIAVVLEMALCKYVNSGEFRSQIGNMSCLKLRYLEIPRHRLQNLREE